MNIFRFALLLFIAASAALSTAGAADTLFNQVHLEVEAAREIPNDELTLLLIAEAEGEDPARIAARVNRDMQWALDHAGQYNDLNARSLSYHTLPVYDAHTRVAWRAEQALELKGANITALTELGGKLQARLQIRGMDFSPAAKAREQYENELIEEALSKFKQRIAIIKKHMDQQNMRIISLRVDTSGGLPQPMPYDGPAMMMSAEADNQPALRAGASRVVVTVSGSVQFF